MFLISLFLTKWEGRVIKIDFCLNLIIFLKKNALSERKREGVGARRKKRCGIGEGLEKSDEKRGREKKGVKQ